MRRLAQYGPSLIVLITASLVLLLGPAAVRQITFAQGKAQAIQASNRLEHSTLLEQLNQAYRDIAAAVEPSVVHISAEQMVRDGGRQVMLGSSGSGWIYDNLGHIVTNAHVIEDAQRIEVQLQGGELRQAELVGRDQQTDIAVIRIDPARTFPAQLGSSDMVRQGDQVFAFGSPFDFRFSMSSGIVSGTGRSAGGLTDIHYQDFIQVDAAINPGNSGGPLTDIDGRVIGMNTAIATEVGGQIRRGQFGGIGLAIPMSMIKPVVKQLIEDGEVSKGWMGVNLVRDNEEAIRQARSRGFMGQGVQVDLVEPGSPAAAAGLIANDIITHVDSRGVENRDQVRSVVSSKRPGETVALDVWRLNDASGAATEIDLVVTLALLDAAVRSPEAVELVRRLGLHEIATSTKARAADLGVPYRRGVLIGAVAPASPYADKVRPGAVILSVEGSFITNADEFYHLIDQALFNSLQARVSRPRLQVAIINPDGDEQQIMIARDLEPQRRE